MPTQPVLLTGDQSLSVTLSVHADGGWFWWDIEGDGVFETTGSTNSITVEVVEPRLFASQVTALSCTNGAVLVASANWTAFRVAAPVVEVSFRAVPSSGTFTPGSLVGINVRIAADVRALPVTGVLNWGDGVTECLEIRAAAEDRTLFHSYDSTGVFPLRIHVQDRFSRSASASLDPVVSLRVETWVPDAPGSGKRGGWNLWYPDGSTTVLLAQRTDGVSWYAWSSTGGLRYVQRHGVRDDIVVDAMAVMAAFAEKLLWVATREHGVVVLNVSEPTAPTQLIVQPPAIQGLAGDNSGIQLCNGEREIWLANRNGYYGWTLTNPSSLTAALAGTAPSASPWRALIHPGGTPFRLGSDQSPAMACIGDRYYVIDGDSISILRVTADTAGVVSEVFLGSVVPSSDVETIYGGIPSDLAVAARSATLDTLIVMLGEDGSVQYDITVTGDAAAGVVMRHRRTERTVSSFSAGDFVPEPHTAALVTGATLILSVAGIDGTNVHYRLATTAAASNVTELVRYSPKRRCNPESGAFSGLMQCRIAGSDAPLRLDRVAKDTYWYGGHEMLYRYGGMATPELAVELPPRLEAMAADDNGIWLIFGKWAQRFTDGNLDGVAQRPGRTLLSDANQQISLSPDRLDPVQGNGHVLVSGDQIAWIDTSGGQFTVGPATSTNLGIVDVAGKASERQAILLDSTTHGMHFYAFPSGQEPQRLWKDTGSAFWGAAGCDDRLLAWTQSGGRRIVLEANSTGLRSVTETIAGGFLELGCTFDTVILLEAQVGQRFVLKAVNPQTGDQETRVELPFVANLGMAQPRLATDASLVAAQLAGAGVFIYDLAADPPALVAADRFADIAKAGHFWIRWEGAGLLRYGGLLPSGSSNIPILKSTVP